MRSSRGRKSVSKDDSDLNVAAATIALDPTLKVPRGRKSSCKDDSDNSTSAVEPVLVDPPLKSMRGRKSISKSSSVIAEKVEIQPVLQAKSAKDELSASDSIDWLHVPKKLKSSPHIAGRSGSAKKTDPALCLDIIDKMYEIYYDLEVLIKTCYSRQNLENYINFIFRTRVSLLRSHTYRNNQISMRK